MSPSAPSPEVVNALVANHRRFLSFLEARLGSRDLAEDVLQAAFIKGIEKGGSLREEESAVAWGYRVLRNAIVDLRRRHGAEARAVERLAREPGETADPELERAVCECFADLLPALKPEYADLLRQVDLEGRSVAEAARRARITANNAAVRLHRARQALRRQLELACGTCTEHGCLSCDCRRRAEV